MSKVIRYIGHMTEVMVPGKVNDYVFKNGVARFVPDDLAAELLKQEDKYEAATEADIPAVPDPAAAPVKE